MRQGLPCAGRAPAAGLQRAGPWPSPQGTHVVRVLNELDHVAGVVRQLPDGRLGDDVGELLSGEKTRWVTAGTLGPGNLPTAVPVPRGPLVAGAWRRHPTRGFFHGPGADPASTQLSRGSERPRAPKSSVSAPKPVAPTWPPAHAPGSGKQSSVCGDAGLRQRSAATAVPRPAAQGLSPRTL